MLRTCPPSPTLPPGWTLLTQRDFFGVRGDLGQPCHSDTLFALATSVDVVCARLGWKIERGRIFVLGENISVHINISHEGEVAEWAGRSKLRGQVAGRLCARILRYIEGLHEGSRQNFKVRGS